MADAVEQAQLLLRARLDELEHEAGGLKQALAALNRASSKPMAPRPASAGPAKAKPKPASGNRRRGSRAAPGEREQQLFSSIDATPSLSVSQHATKIGISAQQAYPLLKRLEQAGRIEKGAAGWRTRDAR